MIIAGHSDPDDREVLRDGRPVGRVHYAQNMLPPCVWLWFAGQDSGAVETLAEGLEAVRAAILKRDG